MSINLIIKSMSIISPLIRALSRTRLVSRLKNKPTRVNERETTKRLRRFSSSTISPGCKIQPPPCRSPSNEGWRAFSPSWFPRRVPAISPFVPSPPPPPRLHPHCLDSSLGDAPFSEGRMRTTMRPSRKSAAAPGTSTGG